MTETDMNRDRFLQIFDNQIGDREGKDALRDWLLSDDCDFFIAPASTKYHSDKRKAAGFAWIMKKYGERK